MKFGVVIVTFNRLSKLQEALSRFNNQAFKPSYILVVNNASTDGTAAYLDGWKACLNSDYQRYVYHCNINSGGSGGFYTALTEALKLEAEWIWVSDDDAFPDEFALKYANDYLVSYEDNRIAAICATVINNGEIDRAHRRRISKGIFSIKEYYVDQSEYKNHDFLLDEFSYVGVIINKSVLSKVGVTNKDLFINQDDTEHSLRISKVGEIVCVPNIKVYHNTGKNDVNNVSWKRYYEIRNRYYAYRDNFPPKYCKYYYFSTFLKYIIKKTFRLRSSDELEMYRCALQDIKRNKMGIHDVFRPGWKSK